MIVKNGKVKRISGQEDREGRRKILGALGTAVAALTVESIKGEMAEEQQNQTSGSSNGGEYSKPSRESDHTYSETIITETPYGKACTSNSACAPGTGGFCYKHGRRKEIHPGPIVIEAKKSKAYGYCTVACNSSSDCQSGYRCDQYADPYATCVR